MGRPPPIMFRFKSIQAASVASLFPPRHHMAILGDYVNGNHRTILYDDGTRFRETGSYIEGKWVADDADHFTFDFPESFDLKVTDCCDSGCSWCHENSTVNGKHGDLSKLDHIVETIRPGTEIAVGGGELLHLVKENLVHGIGISLTDSSKAEDLNFIDKLGPNVVIHVIAGIFEDKDIPFVRGRKVLILGYKMLRRGDSYLADPRKYAEVVHHMELLRVHWQHILAKECKAVAYDNLAIEQLGPKDELCITDTKYARLYQGNDTECFDADGKMTCSTMFIDLPNMQVARMSTAPMETRQPFTGNESIGELLKLTTKGWAK